MWSRHLLVLIRHVQMGDGRRAESSEFVGVMASWLWIGCRVPFRARFASTGEYNNLREMALCLQQNCSSVAVSSVRTGS